MDAIFHSRLADVRPPSPLPWLQVLSVVAERRLCFLSWLICMQIYSTLGGLDNLRTARKHYAHSIQLNKKRNLRAYFALVTCTKAIAVQRGYRADQDDDGINERLQTFALDFIQDFYATQAAPDLTEIVDTAKAEDGDRQVRSRPCSSPDERKKRNVSALL
ncbi:hypothetical protein BBJ28_00025955 [Nothophytophthora sp. Chile5]|nr:hypothetical protein BBJ28_00025955 [Nothophytophthora sp. Chile5]